MHYLVKSLPSKIHSEIACIREQNIDQFSLPNIHSLEAESPLRYSLLRIYSRLRIPLSFSPVRWRLRHSQADIVHSHFGNVGASDSRVVRGFPVRHIVTFYGYDVGRLPRVKPQILPKYREMFQHASAILCEGNHMASQIERLGCPRDKIIVQHLGVDLEQFEFRPRQWQPNVPLKVLIAASFREKKGIPYALKGLAKLANEVEIKITIVGDATREASAQKEKRKIKEIAEESGLSKCITWAGFQPHEKMLELAYEHHLFVSTSVEAKDGDCEGGAPVSIIEMAATGMPVVSSLHCDIPEVVLDGKTGWLAEERDADSIARCLRNAVSDHSNWQIICRSARDHIEQNYSLRRQGERLAELYAKVMSESPLGTDCA